MLFPVRQLIEGHGKPLCVQRNATVRDALKLMISNDYSQLPVLRENGSLLGIISEHSIIKTNFHIDGKVNILDMRVDHCLEEARTISPDSDLFRALDELQHVYAVIVVENDRPIAILTDYDTTRFYRDFSDGLILVEDIELSLRRLIVKIYSKDNALQEACKRAFGPAQGSGEPLRDNPEDFTFKDSILLITKNWADFSGILDDKMMFINVIEPVREIRNQMTHFRGRLDPVQRDKLLTAREWLNNHLPSSRNENIVAKTRINEIDGHSSTAIRGKYAGFQEWLAKQSLSQDAIVVKFEDIEKVMGDKLPPSAYTHRAWWANDAKSHSHARSWLEAGYKVEEVNMNGKAVTFRRYR